VFGNSAYPTEEHLLIPFRGALTQDQEIYNVRQSSQRICTEATIARLKGRFRSPSKMGKVPNHKFILHVLFII
jgi:hypothetical protein